MNKPKMRKMKKGVGYDSDKSKTALADPLYKQYQEAIRRECIRKGVPLPNQKEALEEEQRKDMDGIMALEQEAQAIYQGFEGFFDELWQHRSSIFKGGLSNFQKVSRISQEDFQEHISKAVKEGDYQAGRKMHINAWAFKLLEETYWNPEHPRFVGHPLPPEHQVIKQKWAAILKLQERLVLSLLPLALGRASQFWRAVPPVAHLSHMDLVQYANQALLQVIRKWRGPYETKFRVVVSYAVSSILIPTYSAPFMKMGTLDLDTLYSANKSNAKTALEDEDENAFDVVASKVNEIRNSRKNPTQAPPAQGPEVRGLLLAQSYTSASTPTGDEDGTQLQDWWVDSFTEEDLLDKIETGRQLTKLVDTAQRVCSNLELKALALETGFSGFIAEGEEA